jgi:hypothetical protein
MTARTAKKFSTDQGTGVQCRNLSNSHNETGQDYPQAHEKKYWFFGDN